MSLYCRCRASRVDGLPLHIHWGLRRGPASPSRLISVMGLSVFQASRLPFVWPPMSGPASKYVIVMLMSGLPRGRVSLLPPLEPPAWTGLPVPAELRRGLPVPTGLPVVFHLASGVDRPPCMLLCCRHRASRVNGLPLHAGSGLRRGPASSSPLIYVMGLPLRRASRL